MKLLALVLFGTFCAMAQTCAHTAKYAPRGPVMLYQNGALLQPGEFTLTAPASGIPTLEPKSFRAGDALSVAFSRDVSWPLVINGVTVAYVRGYQLWKEDWTCTESNGGPMAIWSTCETGAWDGIAGIISGAHTLLACENLSDGDLRITRATCRSDAPGQTLDILTPNSSGALVSILASPIVCGLTRTEGVLLPGVTYPKGEILRFVFSIATARQVIGTVTLTR